MRRSGRRNPSKGAASLAAISLAFCVGCSTVGVVERPLCPIPSEEEVDDYDELERSGKHRPTIRWVGRLIAYCFPEVTALEVGDG